MISTPAPHQLASPDCYALGELLALACLGPISEEVSRRKYHLEISELPGLPAIATREGCKGKVVSWNGSQGPDHGADSPRCGSDSAKPWLYGDSFDPFAAFRVLGWDLAVA